VGANGRNLGNLVSYISRIASGLQVRVEGIWIG
jgi:hypothetical protein